MLTHVRNGASGSETCPNLTNALRANLQRLILLVQHESHLRVYTNGSCRFNMPGQPRQHQ